MTPGREHRLVFVKFISSFRIPHVKGLVFPCWYFIQRSRFLHARSDLEVAHYKLKSRGRVLHHEFLQRVRQLPLELAYGEYRDLFRDFGTHYITEAVLGGVYEYTLIVDQEALEKSGTRPEGPRRS